jgi:3-deoxy-7-phosphoheptulonate synthase
MTMQNIQDLPFFITGPCSLESWEQMVPIVNTLSRFNLTYVRAPLFKPRTHPDSFQGLQAEGLPIIKKLLAADLKLVTEVCSKEQLEMIKSFVSMIQIGTRNMQNFELLKDIGKEYFNCALSPYVLLKRGFANTFEEWISSAKYLERYGVPREKIILCERGSRCHTNVHNVVLDMTMVFRVKNETSYKVIIDPSHGTKIAHMVLPMAKVSLALPIDGMMIESHPIPKASYSDAQQAISTDQLAEFLIENGAVFGSDNTSSIHEQHGLS